MPSGSPKSNCSSIDLLLAKPCQQSHIVHEPLDQILVAIGLIVHDQQALFADFGARHFDLEFVLFVEFIRRLVLGISVSRLSTLLE